MFNFQFHRFVNNKWTHSQSLTTYALAAKKIESQKGEQKRK